jgi:hypothetical protein
MRLRRSSADSFKNNKLSLVKSLPHRRQTRYLYECTHRASALAPSVQRQKSHDATLCFSTLGFEHGVCTRKKSFDNMPPRRPLDSKHAESTRFRVYRQSGFAMLRFIVNGKRFSVQSYTPSPPSTIIAIAIELSSNSSRDTIFTAQVLFRLLAAAKRSGIT